MESLELVILFTHLFIFALSIIFSSKNVQRRVSKFILRYPENMNYKERLSNLGMMPLEYRREMADLILFFKLQSGIIDLDFRKYCTKVVDHGHRTRNFDTNNFDVKIIKKGYLKHSFFNRVIFLWNKLPRSLGSIETLTLTSFKQKLFDFYSKKFEMEHTWPV